MHGDALSLDDHMTTLSLVQHSTCEPLTFIFAS